MATGKILITGFEPFLGDRENPSRTLVEMYRAQGEPDVGTLVLPVSFRRSVEVLEDHLNRHGWPEFLLMLGLAKGREAVCLERVALNWIEGLSPDEDGDLPSIGPIIAGAAGALMSELPIQDWAEALNRQGFPCKVSLNAGGYVCNHLLFEISRKNPTRAKTGMLFVHIPATPDLVSEEPNLPIEVTKSAIDHLLKLIRNHQQRSHELPSSERP